MPPETPLIESIENAQGSTAPNLDAELDAALTKSFGRNADPSKNESPLEKPKEKPVEDKVVPPVQEKAEAPKPPEKNKEVLPKVEEIAEKPPEDGSDKDKQAGWNSLRSNYKKAKAVIQEKDETIKKLESVLAEKGTTTTKEVEALKAKIQELSKFQATADLQTDPEFVSKFDAPIQEKVDSLKTLLKEWEISDDVINKIDFSNKQTLGAIAKAIRANEENIASEFSIEEFMTNARDVIELHKKKNAALEEHGKNYKQVLEDRKKQSFAKSAEEEGATFRHVQQIAATKDQAGNNVFPFLNKVEAKEGMTPAEIADVENHNKFVDSMYEKIDSEIKVNDPERKAKLVIAAAASHYLSAQLKATTAKLKSVQEELKKVSVISGESEKSKPKIIHRNGNGDKPVDVDDALSAHFSKVR